MIYVISGIDVASSGDDDGRGFVALEDVLVLLAYIMLLNILIYSVLTYQVRRLRKSETT